MSDQRSAVVGRRPAAEGMVMIVRPGRQRALNYGRPMRYFLPEWDDLVDPGYLFQVDAPTPGKRRYTDEVFGHQLYGQPNCDFQNP